MKKGFTLIELLVVVLIIGILSAIALPQYQVAVAKSRFARMMPVVRAMADGLEMYYLANSGYPPDTSEDVGLTIHYPSGCSYSAGATTSASCPDGFRYDILDYGTPNVLGLDTRFKTAYVQWAANSDHPRARRCIAKSDTPSALQVCKSLGGRQINESYRWVTEGDKLGSGITVFDLD